MKKKSYAKIFMFIILLLFFTALSFEYIKEIGTKKIVIKEYNLTSKKIPKELDSLKIVQISDIHYGTTIQKKN